jgi:DNA (cytosine-5)-methyltransferase 1
MGCKKGLRLPIYPQPSGRVTVAEAIGDLPDADEYDSLLDSDVVKARLKKPSPYAAVLRGLIEDLGDLSYRREFNNSLLTNSIRTEHTDLSKRRFAATEVGETEPISRFFKLDPKGQCNTLRAGTDSARGAFTSPRPIHPIYPRVITVREAARLHSYPDWFRFHVTKWHGFRQIGNSVPPFFARRIAAQIAAAGGYKPHKPVEALPLGDTQLLQMDMSHAVRYFQLRGSPIANRLRPTDESMQLELGINEKRPVYA